MNALFVVVCAELGARVASVVGLPGHVVAAVYSSSSVGEDGGSDGSGGEAGTVSPQTPPAPAGSLNLAHTAEPSAEDIRAMKHTVYVDCFTAKVMSWEALTETYLQAWQTAGVDPNDPRTFRTMTCREVVERCLNNLRNAVRCDERNRFASSLAYMRGTAFEDVAVCLALERFKTQEYVHPNPNPNPTLFTLTPYPLLVSMSRVVTAKTHFRANLHALDHQSKVLLQAAAERFDHIRTSDHPQQPNQLRRQRLYATCGGGASVCPGRQATCGRGAGDGLPRRATRTSGGRRPFLMGVPQAPLARLGAAGCMGAAGGGRGGNVRLSSSWSLLLPA